MEPVENVELQHHIKGRLVRRKQRGARGQGLVEYALILVLVATVVIGVLSLVGTATQGAFGIAVGALQGQGQGVSNGGNLTITSATCTGGTLTIQGYSAYDGSTLIMRVDLHGYTFSLPNPAGVNFTMSAAGMLQCPNVVILQHPPSGNIAAARVRIG